MESIAYMSVYESAAFFGHAFYKADGSSKYNNTFEASIWMKLMI